MTRRTLAIAVALMASMIVAASIWVVGSSLAPTDAARTRSTYLLKVEELRPGEIREYELDGGPLLVYRPTNADMANLKFLDAHVWHPESKAFVTALGAFVYWGYSTKFGCKLQHIPPGKFTTALDRNIDWRGAYVDPCHGPNYDYAGRTIKTYEFTRNGYSGEHPNLYVPTVAVFTDRIVEIRPK